MIALGVVLGKQAVRDVAGPLTRHRPEPRPPAPEGGGLMCKECGCETSKDDE